MMANASMNLAQKIAKASAAIGGKLKADARNQEQKYNYISADKILSVCGQALADVGVTVFPSVVGDVMDVFDRGNNKVRYDATVTFMMHVSDGETSVDLPWIGRGSDYTVPDKALYKAITSGHKYFVAKLFNIGEGNEDSEHEAAEPVTGVTPAPTSGNGHETPPLISDAQMKMFHALGTKFYGDEWNDKRPQLVGYITGGRTVSSKQLTVIEATKLLDGLRKKIDERDAEAEADDVFDGAGPHDVAQASGDRVAGEPHF
jgi:hypothetical protein